MLKFTKEKDTITIRAELLQPLDTIQEINQIDDHSYCGHDERYMDDYYRLQDIDAVKAPVYRQRKIVISVVDKNNNFKKNLVRKFLKVFGTYEQAKHVRDEGMYLGLIASEKLV